MWQKFTFAPDAISDVFVLGDDDAGAKIRVTGRGHDRSANQVEMFQADYVQTQALGNRRNEVSFQVDTEFDTMEEAVNYLADFPDSLPHQGILTWITGSTMRVMNDAALRSVRMVSLDGRSLVLAYTFMGGALADGT